MMKEITPILKQIKKLYVSKPEFIVFSERLRLAGTIDVLAKRKIQLGVYLFDWKTNKKIVKANKYRKYAKFPIEHLPDNNYTKYALQLNLYEYLLKYENYIPKNVEVKKGLIHITQDSIKPYVVSDMKLEIQSMVDYRLRELEVMEYGSSDGIIP